MHLKGPCHLVPHLPEMIQGSVAVPDARCVLNRAGDVLLGLRHGVHERVTMRELRGNGRRERAAGPMGVTGTYPRRLKFCKQVIVKQQVHQLVALGVSTLDQDGGGAEIANPDSRLPGMIERDDRDPAQHLGFRDIWRDDASPGQKFVPERDNRVIVEEACAAFGHHHRIHDDERQLELGNGGRDGLDDRGGGEHAGLGRVECEIAGDRFYLRGHEVGRERDDSCDAACILRRDRRDRGRAVDAVRGKCFQVGLDSSAAARVASRDCQHRTHTLRSVSMQAETLLATMTMRADSRGLRDAGRALAVVGVTILTAIAAQVSLPLPFTPVPFTFQPMVVLVGGALLGARLGMTSQMLYLAAGIAGLPVFAASPVLPQGLARIIGPTGGYLLSYPFAAFVAGWLAERRFDRRYLTSVAAMACGLGVVFTFGVAWLAWFTPAARGVRWALATGFVPFVAADLVKLFVAAGVMPSVWRLTGSDGR